MRKLIELLSLACVWFLICSYGVHFDHWRFWGIALSLGTYGFACSEKRETQ